jgi:superfamily II helicase
MKVKAFVSSTSGDLLEHRKHVIEQLRKAGFTVDPMEDWASSSKALRLYQSNASRAATCASCS